MDEVAASLKDLKMSLSFKLWSDNVNWKSCIFKPTGAEESLEQNLINELLRGYNKDAHPIPEQNKSLYLVTFGLELVQLVNVVSSNTVTNFSFWDVHLILLTPSDAL